MLRARFGFHLLTFFCNYKKFGAAQHDFDRSVHVRFVCTSLLPPMPFQSFTSHKEKGIISSFEKNKYK